MESGNTLEQTPVGEPSASPPAPMETPVTSAEPEEQLVSPASATEGGRKLSATTIYVGGIHHSITETALKGLFSSYGSFVRSIKLLADKNRSGFNYSFIEFESHSAAQTAFSSLNGAVLEGYPLTISWAFRTQQSKTTSSYNLFVGDLSPEVDDESLSSAFGHFQSLIQASVMWDMKSGYSRGYGFVSFANLDDATKCLETMSGAPICGRPVRLNWATRNVPRHEKNLQLPKHSLPVSPTFLPQTWNTTIYLGNLPRSVSQNDLILLLQNFGYIVDFQHLSEKSCAFVKYDSHAHAASALMQLANMAIQGRPLKCGWGKQKVVYRRH
ncbi:hypothetical protein OGAPHI_004240 [Ogataea philodendri]|uniref:RRM domain-containing protein n=1 Tax=Ogataea philodendri TaxID=1378263 RepID=A0A9P8T5L5_9ASCO|nr:uncharacterized protein OGAPHI_004240 [Ogataea philodendri]KAH3666051.1 hypothetical protein OGAPHI_004240 [Ogataea philodendri]